MNLDAIREGWDARACFNVRLREKTQQRQRFAGDREIDQTGPNRIVPIQYNATRGRPIVGTIRHIDITRQPSLMHVLLPVLLHLLIMIQLIRLSLINSTYGSNPKSMLYTG